LVAFFAAFLVAKVIPLIDWFLLPVPLLPDFPPRRAPFDFSRQNLKISLPAALLACLLC
jgi:hypothetical protein